MAGRICIHGEGEQVVCSGLCGGGFTKNRIKMCRRRAGWTYQRLHRRDSHSRHGRGGLRVFFVKLGRANERGRLSNALATSHETASISGCYEWNLE